MRFIFTLVIALLLAGGAYFFLFSDAETGVRQLDAYRIFTQPDTLRAPSGDDSTSTAEHPRSDDRRATSPQQSAPRIVSPTPTQRAPSESVPPDVPFDDDSTARALLARLITREAPTHPWQSDSTLNIPDHTIDHVYTPQPQPQLRDNTEDRRETPLYNLLPATFREHVPLHLMNELDRELAPSMTQRVRIGVLATQGAREYMAIRGGYTGSISQYAQVVELEMLLTEYRLKLDSILDTKQQIALDRFIVNHQTELTRIAQRMIRSM